MNLCKMLIACGIVCSSCQTYYVSVFKQKIDRNYLASSHIGSPDPRQKNPPYGQMLTIDWNIPKSILDQHPKIVLDVIYWDNTHDVLYFPIDSRIGYTCYKLLNETYEAKKGFLAYKAHIVTENGTIYREWTHQLWVHWIQEEEVLSY